jgi:hypothetical protein
MTAEQAIHNFWSGFGLTAYEENSVSDEAELPYITYSVSYDTFGNSVPMSASIWYRSTSWGDLIAKKDLISEAIGEESVLLPTDEGSVRIWRGSPFAQRMGDVDNSIKRYLLNITAEYNTFY